MLSSLHTKLVFPFLFLALQVTGALGVPMWDSPSTVGQPDGSRAAVRLFGDEFYHWMESADGFVPPAGNNPSCVMVSGAGTPRGPRPCRA